MVNSYEWITNRKEILKATQIEQAKSLKLVQISMAWKKKDFNIIIKYSTKPRIDIYFTLLLFLLSNPF